MPSQGIGGTAEGGEIFGARRVRAIAGETDKKKCSRSLGEWWPCDGWDMDIHEETESVKCVIIKNENLGFMNQLLCFCPFKCFLKQKKGKNQLKLKIKNRDQNLQS